MSKRIKNNIEVDELKRSAVRLMNTDGMIVRHSKRIWKMMSETKEDCVYTVRITNRRIKCDCPYHTNRNGAACKHTLAAELLLLKEAQPKKLRKPFIIKEVGVHCPVDKTHRFKKNSRRKCKKRGTVQRYKCVEPGCGRGFCDDIGFKGRHYPPFIILMAITLFSIGVSPKTISTIILLPRLKVDVPAYTIQRWGDHYTSLVEEYTNTLRPNLGRLWGCDEKFQRILGIGHWIFTVQDIVTRFIMTWDVSPKKTNYDPRCLFQKAQERAGHPPKLFKTDGLKVFRPAFRDVFKKSTQADPLHLWSSHMRNEYSDNNIHERFNGTLGELLHGCRGLKKLDAALIKAALLHYNYVRPHQSLCGKTPAWKAGLRISGTDKWLILIQNAAVTVQ